MWSGWTAPRSIGWRVVLCIRACWRMCTSTTYSVGDLVASATPSLIVVLDGVEDPHNVGAVVRAVDAAGADGVVRQTRRAAPLDAATAKASAGALAHVKVASVVNIARALEELKELGVWTVGLAADAPKRYDEADLTGPTALVLGREGTGLRRLVRERCDWLVRIPMRGQVGQPQCLGSCGHRAVRGGPAAWTAAAGAG